ncbi:site-2 protease family protein [Clostridium sp.]|uniref:site-2 protease family protein n=1 Tax=Clostridium sp. TaxID=1506 RepID=UPI003F40F518
MKKETKIFWAEILLIILICSRSNELALAFLYVMIHEIAHIIVASMMGCKFYNMEIHIFGARAAFVDFDTLTDVKKIIVYLAGPVCNIGLALLFSFINIYNDLSWVTSGILLNSGLAFFNLLPAYPLDGARIYEILISKKMLYKKAKKVVSISSYFTAVLFFIIAIVLFVKLHIFNWSMVIGAFIIIYITRGEQKSAMYITMGNIIKKRKKLIKNKYLDNKSISVYYKHSLVNVLALVDINKFNSFYILNDDMKMIGIMYEDELIDALKIYGSITLEDYINIKNKESN